MTWCHLRAMAATVTHTSAVVSEITEGQMLEVPQKVGHNGNLHLIGLCYLKEIMEETK